MGTRGEDIVIAEPETREGQGGYQEDRHRGAESLCGERGHRWQEQQPRQEEREIMGGKTRGMRRAAATGGEEWRARGLRSHVTTDGSVRPVYSVSFEILSAMSAIGLTTSKACLVRSASGAAYSSRYIRIVAPATPVPERRKTKRDPDSKMKRTPWFFETEPSTGSWYSNMSAFAIFMPSTVVPIRAGCASTIAAIIFSAAGLSTPS
mmetsp:Transcript_2630/g.8758  ORF Transcript_2630/g.8758 Transcript_2630/m.8758 type:complete len:207 (-) Transcript_2630:1425-2045(-)